MAPASPTPLRTGSDRRPRPASAVVPREGPVKQLLDVPRSHLVTVVAPAGYGKTTTLALWDRADERPFAWVLLDRLDDDPAHLVHHIAGSIERSAGLSPAASLTLSSPGHTVPELIEAVAEGIETADELVVVLDDVHLLGGAAIDALALLIGRLPGGVQVVLSARTLERIGLAAQRSAGMLTELDASDLAMTDDESRSLFERLGLDADPEVLAVVVDRTEGWVAGLRLVALALERGWMATPDLLTGRHRFLADYLVEEVLGAMPPGEVSFLEEASLLDILDGPLLDEVLERNGSTTLLRALAATLDAFLVPLDDERDQYRFHHLLGELLADRLRARDPGLARRLEARASAVLERRGDVDGAVVHAIGAGDLDRTADLVQARAAGLALSGRVGTLSRWLDLVGRAGAESDVRFALARAWRAVAESDEDELLHWIAVVECLPIRRGLPDGSPDSEVAVAVVRALAGVHGLDRIVTDCERVRGAGGPGENPWWAIAVVVEGSVHYMRGDLARTRDLLEEGLPFLGRAPGFHAPTLAYLGLIALDEGDAEGAALRCGQAVEVAERSRLAGFAPAMVVYAAAALVDAGRGRDAASLTHAATARGILGRLGGLAPRTMLFGHVTLARAALARGDMSAARAHVQAADRARRREPDATLLVERLGLLHAALDAPGGVEADLTDAERRVLLVLPSHLSLQRIADELLLSRNTVKSHCNAIYRKLGVTSRSAAVIEAERRGLLVQDRRRR